MNIQRYLKSIILASTLSLGCVAMQTAVSADYKIVNVANWDSLNVRNGAGTGYDIVSEIPANSGSIKSTGDTKDVGGSTWVKITWNGQSGWVNNRYLETTGATSTNNMKQTYYNPQPAKTTTTYSSYSPRATTNNNQHTHPENRCTRSISHQHTGPSNHAHQYSCQNKGRQQQVTQYNAKTTDIYGKKRTAYTPKQNTNTHRHPANQCTRSISHSHIGSANHKHSYSCQNNKGRQQVNYRTNRLQHSHGKSQCVSAIGHTHKGGDNIHRHECPASRNNAQSGNKHTHPANSLTRATTHSHPFQDQRHSHRYGR